MNTNASVDVTYRKPVSVFWRYNSITINQKAESHEICRFSPPFY